MTDSGDRANGPYDLLLLVDGTYSMKVFVEALNKSLQEVISISALTACFERIGVLAYRDYCAGELTEWSGWCSPSGKVQGPDIVSQDEVLKMARGIVPDHGGDWPEAVKTGLAQAYSEMRSDATTIILLYTDAPPHFKETDGPNFYKEKTALSKNTKYGKTDSLFVDWTSAAKTLRSGPKKGVVFSMVQKFGTNTFSPYLYLSTITGGNLFLIEEMVADKISQLTLGVLLTWMRLGKTMTDTKTSQGFIVRYKSIDKLETFTKEDDTNFTEFIIKGHSTKTLAATTLRRNTTTEEITLGGMSGVVKARGPKVGSFAEKYANDEEYKKLAAEQLRRIIETSVSAVSVNPIFGSLWRAVCNDRTNPARDELIQLFGLSVDRISDADEKARMKTWLAESYNYVDEINDLIKSVASEERFPLLFLDPTADFGTANDGGDDDNSADNRRLQDFTRAELLEIGRSCDYKILRRLGKVLTRLTFVQDKESLPEHIRKMGSGKGGVACVPLALTKETYKRQFWKILLHAVLPGTKLGARPAALLAALALRMGIAPLRDAADQELMHFRDNWNTIEIPETWNLGCFNLLLDADDNYEKRVADGATARQTPDSRILNERDRDVFRSLVDYKMLELNLETTLQAKIGWSPDKDKVPLGPVVICKKCELPRSVTIMASGGVCGLCEVETTTCPCLVCRKAEDHEERLKKNVSADHNETSTAYWVECGQTACRAQYVVYNPDALNVRPKCYFCRHAEKGRTGQAPAVECSKCLNRIIWPYEHRPEDLDFSKYECSACLAGKSTVIEEETSARKLSNENGWEWLLKNEDKTIKEPFNGRTVFYTASHCTLENLPTKVEVLPAVDSEFSIRGKLVRNSEDLRGALLKWVKSRRTESATCSLCFSNFRKSDIRQACGRSGCNQLICNGCRKDWYGINAPGRIINVAALRCPFCRRQPAPKVVSSFGITRLGDLRSAVEESGSWIYAWCVDCGFARQYVERVCAAGAPEELTGWRCEPCTPAKKSNNPTTIPMCPGCGVATEKTSGCDHITCPCGTHWCYACGEATDPGEIYTHISREHGGLEWDDDGDDDDYY
ncbi:Putative ariadne-like RING finger-like protein [Cladobotryum mycophilum]|uniref:Ariadne-like RING finger-like protein n=1 Tax=Cladobotryum mycophilum TaxID=491253 RepID=A0ABR0SWU2_9HYPO